MSATADEELAELRRALVELQRSYVEVRNERDAARTELQARTRALAQRNSEYGERIEHQAATIDLLKVMSASPGDTQPVFDQIVNRAQELCNGWRVGLFEFDGELVHHRASTMANISELDAAAYLAVFPMTLTRGSIICRAILDRQTIHIRDMDTETVTPVVRGLLHKSQLAIPLLRDNVPIGAISIGALEPGGFSDSQVALLQTFAEQAVIAITSAETYRALQGRTSELQEALEQQTATAEVLQVINANPGNLTPVFQVILAKARSLCGADSGSLGFFDGQKFYKVARHGYAAEGDEYLSKPYEVESQHAPLLRGETIHVPDIANHTWETDEQRERMQSWSQQCGLRTWLEVPLWKGGRLLGTVSGWRIHARAFSSKEITLLENFAAQAVIAMENARLLNEQREALEQQTATAEVLQVINASPGNLAPVFDAMLEKAMRLCEATIGILFIADGEVVRVAQSRNVPADFKAYLEREPPRLDAGSLLSRAMREQQVLNVTDLRLTAPFRDGVSLSVAAVELGGIRSICWVPLIHQTKALGLFAIFRQEVRAFSDKQIALLENFAAQAVIAIENARLLNEIRQRQEELRITFENMGDGVAFFDEKQHLVAWNSKFQEVFDLPDDLLQQHRTYEDYLRFLAERGDFGAAVDTVEQISELVATTGQPYGYERTRPDGRVIEIRRNPVPDGGFVLIFSDITERKRSEAEIRAARDAAEAAYRDLKAAQASLIQAEKMASLGQLTAGIAHEIKNPLNFVNNFASLSVDLLDELKQTAAPGLAMLDEARRSEVDELTNTLASNLDKINEHGRRADGIVRGMLEHSRGSSGERREVDPNTLVDEALNLAYHGARAQDQSFAVTLQREFGEGIAPITLAPQDVTRVLLNLISNGFYAARERQRTEAVLGFEPTVTVSTRDLDGVVEIRVRDNGIGIPAEIKDRLFQPFFTTKPPGEGTGLGLSMSYDIITQQHGGSISVDSKVGEYSDFTVRLPRRS